MYNSQDIEPTKMSSNRSMKTEWSINMLGLFLRLWGWNQEGRMWASDQQLVGRREMSPEVRRFPEVCEPQCPDGLHPQWGHGQARSPFDEATAALGSEVS